MQRQETNKQINDYVMHAGSSSRFRTAVLERLGQTTENFKSEQESVIRPRASQTGPDWLQVEHHLVISSHVIWSVLATALT
jgi:hypothetical protein